MHTIQFNNIKVALGCNKHIYVRPYKLYSHYSSFELNTQHLTQIQTKTVTYDST